MRRVVVLLGFMVITIMLLPIKLNSLELITDEQLFEECKIIFEKFLNCNFMDSPGLPLPVKINESQISNLSNEKGICPVALDINHKVIVRGIYIFEKANWKTYYGNAGQTIKSEAVYLLNSMDKDDTISVAVHEYVHAWEETPGGIANFIYDHGEGKNFIEGLAYAIEYDVLKNYLHNNNKAENMLNSIPQEYKKATHAILEAKEKAFVFFGWGRNHQSDGDVFRILEKAFNIFRYK